ncbi:replicative DNA helicase [Butyricicoccus porcorum]|uniref:DNA 5'-3' helicase n=1 Tax=Butyricicoccus porcorum TaxID=1945634 RepID=A0A252F2I6_9FIRM|nr:DnaB-like helicase C-terminal domain-containing protein [Butyricicoccus porcorum]OUM20018.1 hypothetical protein CBW42_09755 [Butyricicoccus porcorum]
MNQQIKPPEVGAQEAVLGAMVIEPALVPEIMRKVSAEDFTDPTCRNVYDAIRKLAISSRPVDAVTILGQLGPEYRSYISGLMDVTPTTAGWETYADQMKTESQIFRARKIFGKGMYAATKEEMQQAISDLAGIFVNVGKAEAIPLHKALLDATKELEKEPHYLKFGIDALDDGRLFAEYGDMIIIGARPSVGKTDLALQFAREMSMKDKVGFFSLETAVPKLATRWQSASATVYLDHLKTRKLTQGEYIAIAHANNRDSKYCDMHFVSAAGMTTDDVIDVSIKNQFKIIFIDYLQLIQGKGERDETVRISNISMALHRFAQGTGTTVIALSQLSRAGKNGAGMETLRGSGQIEQDADIVFMLELKDPDDPDSMRTLSIEKNKEGKRGHCMLRFDGGHQRFEYVPPYRKTEKSTERPKKATAEQMNMFPDRRDAI